MPVSLNSGVLGQASPTANTNSNIYIPGAGVCCAVSVTACNKTTTSGLVRVSVTVGATQTYFLYDVPISPAGVQGSTIELRALPLQSGAQLTVRSSVTGVDFTVCGFEQPSAFTSLD